MKRIIVLGLLLCGLSAAWGHTNSVPPLILRGVKDPNAPILPPWMEPWRTPEPAAAAYVNEPAQPEVGPPGEATADTNAPAGEPTANPGMTYGWWLGQPLPGPAGRHLKGVRPHAGFRRPDMERGRRTVEIGQPTIGIGQPNRIGAPTITLGRPNTGIGQTTIGIGRPTIGIGQNNTSIGRPAIGIGQNNTSIGQPTTGIGQTTIGIGQPNTGIGQPNAGADSGQQSTSGSTHWSSGRR